MIIWFSPIWRIWFDSAEDHYNILFAGTDCMQQTNKQKKNEDYVCWPIANSYCAWIMQSINRLK